MKRNNIWKRFKNFISMDDSDYFKSVMIFILTGMLIVMLGVLIIESTIVLFGWIYCIELNENGYITEYKIPNGCFVEMKQIDGSTKFMSINDLGNVFTLENYGMKKEDLENENN